MSDEEPFSDCREDPCGECHYCRFERPAREAELPTVSSDYLERAFADEEGV